MADTHLAVDLKVEASSLADRIKSLQQYRLPAGESNHSSVHGFDICDLGRGFLRCRQLNARRSAQRESRHDDRCQNGAGAMHASLSLRSPRPG
jgi:hypothetical protein